jgi:hypothetical protein
MKATTWLGLGALATVVLVVSALLVGWVIVSRVAGMPMGITTRAGTAAWRPWGGTAALCGPGDWPADPVGATVPAAEFVEAAFLDYLRDRGHDDLVLAEVMEFERNYYAIAEERETGIGAMELLLDKTTGAIGPEIGPNMMWNTVYGMHGGGMMGQRSGPRDTISPDEALNAAERWLALYRPSESPEAHADAFHGYFTIHTVDATGEIVGMLSVHGETGQIWYHTWHGQFLSMPVGESDTQ